MKEITEITMKGRWKSYEVVVGFPRATGVEVQNRPLDQVVAEVVVEHSHLLPRVEEEAEAVGRPKKAKKH
jgi:hypothetical protein